MQFSATEVQAKDLREWARYLRTSPDGSPELFLAIAEIEKAAALNEIATALSLLAHKSRG